MLLHFCLQTIKIEPSSATAPTETWEGSNQSYEDGSVGITGPGSGAGVTPSTSDTITMQLPLHAELTESSQMHDSSRSVGRRLSGRGRGEILHRSVVLGAPTSVGGGNGRSEVEGGEGGNGLGGSSSGSNQMEMGFIGQSSRRDPNAGIGG
ncbi:hypothetical protein SK128_018687, partial [Halocaridina rubra]